MRIIPIWYVECKQAQKKEAVIHWPKWKKLKNIKRVGGWCYQSLEKNLMEEKKKRKKGKKDQGEGQNENFRGSWIKQRPREKGGST